MVNYLALLYSAGVGTILGILYGLSFITAKVHILSRTAQKSPLFVDMLGTAMRLFFVGTILFYILHTTLIHSILVIGMIVIFFWITIVVYTKRK